MHGPRQATVIRSRWPRRGVKGTTCQYPPPSPVPSRPHIARRQTALSLPPRASHHSAAASAPQRSCGIEAWASHHPFRTTAQHFGGQPLCRRAGGGRHAWALAGLGRPPDSGTRVPEGEPRSSRRGSRGVSGGARPAGRRAGDHRQRSLLIPAPGPSTSISPTAGDHRQRVEPVPLGASAGGLVQGPPAGRADAPRRGDSKRARGSGPPGAAGASALGLANAEQVRAGAVLGARLRRRRHVVVGLREPVFVGVGGEGKGNEGPGRASRTRRHTANGYMRRVQAGPSQLHIGREPRGISPTFTPLPCIPHIPLFRIPHIPLYPQHSPKRRNMGSRVTMLRTAVRWARKEGFRA